MNEKFSFISPDLLSKVEKILEEIGIDIETVTRMMMKRIANEQNITFLLPNKINADFPKALTQNQSTVQIYQMTKTKAISLLKNEGCVIKENVTFATKNKAAAFYWANPNFSVLGSDWYIILNDPIKRQLHLFVIPKNTFPPKELICRNDKKHLIDIQIMYDDITFTDTRSKISFSKFLKKSLKY